MRCGLHSVLAMAIGGLLGAGCAHAEIYAFVDPEGVTHFSNVPADERYQLVLGSAAPAAAAETPKNTSAAVSAVLLARAERYDSMIEDAARRADVDSQLVRAVIVVESAYDEHALSARGARGLMQLMPETAQRYGARNAFDPRQNVRAGTRYLRDLLDRYDDDLELVLAAYNAGEDVVDKYGRAIPPFKETRAYVPRVLGVYAALRKLADSTEI
jgi:soluble lytic murein transglycosylase-like protein